MPARSSSGGPQRAATRERTLRAAAGAAILTALFGLWQAQTGLGLQTAWLVFDAGILRINATYTDPNALAAFYALVGPVLAGLAMRSAGWRRAAWSAGTGLVLVAMVMTGGPRRPCGPRGRLLAMAMVALRAGLDEIDPIPLVRRHFRRAVRATVVLLVATLLGLITIGTLLNVRHEQQTTYLHTWLYTFNLRQPPEAIAKGRIAVWQVATAMIKEHPLVGQGLGRRRRETSNGCAPNSASRRCRATRTCRRTTPTCSSRANSASSAWRRSC